LVELTASVVLDATIEVPWTIGLAIEDAVTALAWELCIADNWLRQAGEFESGPRMHVGRGDEPEVTEVGGAE